MSPNRDPATRGDAPEGGGRILVIDDEEVVHASLRRILERRGFHLDAEVTAHGGLARLREERYELVITDLMMPEMNGIELLEAMRTDSIGVPAIMVTGYPTIKTALRALRLGAVDYLAKPFTRKELLGSVNRALRRGFGTYASGVRDTLEPGDDDGVEPPAASIAPGDRVHLRRHSWAVYRQDGAMDVGIGRSFLAAVGAIAEIELPGEGDLVEQGYIGFRIRTDADEEHGVFMPLSGQVIAVNPEVAESPTLLSPDTWVIRIVPDRLAAELSLLVAG